MLNNLNNGTNLIHSNKLMLLHACISCHRKHKVDQ